MGLFEKLEASQREELEALARGIWGPSPAAAIMEGLALAFQSGLDSGEESGIEMGRGMHNAALLADPEELEAMLAEAREAEARRGRACADKRGDKMRADIGALKREFAGIDIGNSAGALEALYMRGLAAGIEEMRQLAEGLGESAEGDSDEAGGIIARHLEDMGADMLADIEKSGWL